MLTQNKRAGWRDGLAFIFFVIAWVFVYCIVCPPARAGTMQIVCAQSDDVLLALCFACFCGAMTVAALFSLRDVALLSVRRRRRL